MATAAVQVKRERPEGGGIVWHEKWNAFECLGCGEFTEVRSASRRTPEKLAELREFLVMDHTECWEFDDPKMAADARKYRSERKRRALLAGNREQGAGSRKSDALDCSGYMRKRAETADLEAEAIRAKWKGEDGKR